jgi:hypothetical protein
MVGAIALLPDHQQCIGGIKFANCNSRRTAGSATAGQQILHMMVIHKKSSLTIIPARGRPCSRAKTGQNYAFDLKKSKTEAFE